MGDRERNHGGYQHSQYLLGFGSEGARSGMAEEGTRNERVAQAATRIGWIQGGGGWTIHAISVSER